MDGGKYPAARDGDTLSKYSEVHVLIYSQLQMAHSNCMLIIYHFFDCARSIRVHGTSRKGHSLHTSNFKQLGHQILYSCGCKDRSPGTNAKLARVELLEPSVDPPHW